MRWPERVKGGPLAVAAGAVLLTAMLGAIALWAGGYDPFAAAQAAAVGAFGSRDALLSITLVRAVPLILTGLAVALAFRAGVWNVGAEGQLYAGAVAGVWVGLEGGSLPGWLLLPAVLVATGVAGALWALVPARPVVRRLRARVLLVVVESLPRVVEILIEVRYE